MTKLALLVIIYTLIVVIPIWVSIIYDKREPIKALSWIVVVTCMPIVGLIIYMFFGQNFRKRKIFNKKQHSYFSNKEFINKQLYSVNSPFSEQYNTTSHLHRDIQTLLLNNNRTPLSTNNSVEVYGNGQDTFNAIKEAMNGAKESIHVEYYIFLNDKIGTELSEIMIRKAKEGVEVRLIFDDVGSWNLKDSFIKNLDKNGVEILPFMPVYFPLFTSKINYRNHRKIVVIDGKIGFTGGINVADKYIEGTKSLGAWRDVHIRLEGNAVMSLQRIFMSDWTFVSGKIIEDKDKYFCLQNPDSDGITMQIASSGPDSDWANIMQAFFAAITRAKEYIYITTPYFTPNSSILTAIKVAALSGMDIRLLLPQRSDTKVVYWATLSYVTELLAAGVKIYLYHGGFIHSKVIIADGDFCSVGTANMDVRSFDDNFEVSALIYDRECCKKLENIFFKDLSHSREIKAETWRQRSRKKRAYESMARLLTPVL